jgi:hypothetical protein
MDIFDEIISIIYSKREGLIINLESEDMFKFIPKIYYIGVGKTGSSSIVRGFLDVNSAHWHNIRFFEDIYDTKLLSNNNYDLYDLVIYIGKKYNFKPTIIESIRNPINTIISDFFQHIKKNRNHTNCEICSIKKYKQNNDFISITKIIKQKLYKNTIRPYSIKMFKKHFNIKLPKYYDKNLKYYFNNKNSVNLLFLKFEDIDNWEEIINKNLPYKFKLKHYNKTTDKFYKDVKNYIVFTEEELKLILSYNSMNFFYSEDEIKNYNT